MHTKIARMPMAGKNLAMPGKPCSVAWNETRRFDRERDRSRSPKSNSRFASSPPRQTAESNSCKVVIRGLPSEYGWAKIKDLFREQVGFTGYLEMVDRGVGVMEFRSADGASKAINVMDGHKLENGSKIRVHEETVRDREEFPRQPNQRRSRNERNDMSGMSNYGNDGARYNGNMRKVIQDVYPDSMNCRNVGMRMGMGMNMGMQQLPFNRQDMREDFNDDFSGLNPQVLSYLGIDGPLTNQVFVWNLDFSVTWQKLKDAFRLAGNVLNVDIKESREGTPRGNAVVTFEHPYEAVQSISMLNNQTLMDRPMRVRMDRDARPGNSSADQYRTRRDNHRHDIGLASGRLPRDLAAVGLTLKELTNKMMMSGSGNMNSNVLPSFGFMGAMGSIPPNGSNNMGPMNGNMNVAANLGGMGNMPQMGDMNSLRGGDGNYMRQMASMTMPGFRGGAHGGSQTRQLMVKNLPFNFGWKELKRIVREVGDVRYADVLYDSNQHSTGLGTVRFSTPEDAERAVRRLDGMVLDGRTIRAELDFKD